MNDTLQKLDKIDWEFEKEDTRYLTHSFHPYRSKYIPQIPRNLINLLSRKSDTVLDCFAGSGTTLVECSLLGRNGIGIDINPLACLISKVKSVCIDVQLLNKQTEIFLNKIREDIFQVRGVKTLMSFAQNSRSRNVEYKIPQFSYIINWFQPHVIRELTIIKKGIDHLHDSYIRNFFLVAFSSILRGVSDAASGFGNLMINHDPPLKRQIFEKFERKVSVMTATMSKFSEQVDDSVKTEVFLGDARHLNFIRDRSVDMICTHPPYMASVPYAEYQKLSLWWLGYDPKKLDAKLIGGQRSREDMAKRYLNDMQLSFKEMHRVLKSDKMCCIVIGNPLWRRRIWPLNDIFKDIGTEVGFRFLKEIVRGKYKTTMGKMKKEYILIFQK